MAELRNRIPGLDRYLASVVLYEDELRFLNSLGIYYTPEGIVYRWFASSNTNYDQVMPAVLTPMG